MGWIPKGRKEWELCRGQLASWVLLLCGLVNLACGTWAGVQGNASLSATLLTAGLVLAFAGTIERFESIKGLGMEAKTKDLDAKISEADQVLRRLRELASLSGASLIQLDSKSGRWGGAPDPAASAELAMRTKQLLQGLGLADEAINQALAPWVHIVVFEIGLAILQPVRLEGYKKKSQLEAQLHTLRSTPQLQDSPELVSLKNRLQKIDAALVRFDELHTWNAKDSPARLQELLASVPEVTSETIASARRNVETWASDCAWLIERLELRSSEKWFDMIRNRTKASVE